MNTRSLSLTVALLGLSVLAGGLNARACKYCWSAEMAASEATQQSMLPQGPANNPPGAFPLDNAISQFAPTAAPSALATPPPAGSIVTSAADLRPTTATTAISSSPPAPVAVASSAHLPARAAGHYADAGLLGLAAVGGVFCWRTRRKTGFNR